ncbi:MAG: hypothetical protein E7259_07080 [Lachnospiraceae bacterium]|nr:hypothetical protein [Lachnospiraceae bacterium]
MRKIKKSLAFVLSAAMMLGAVSQVNYEPLAGTYPQLLELPITTLEIGKQYTVDSSVDMQYEQAKNHPYYQDNGYNSGTLSSYADAVYKITVPAYSQLNLNLPEDYGSSWYDGKGNYISVNNYGSVVNSTATDKTYIFAVNSYENFSFTASLGTLVPDFDGQICVYTQGNTDETSNPLKVFNTEYFRRNYNDYYKNVKIVEIEPHYSAEEYIEQAIALSEMSSSTSIITADSEYVRNFIGTGKFETLSDVGFDANGYTTTAYEYTVARGSENGNLYAVTWQVCPNSFVYDADIAERVLGTSDPAQVQAKIDTTEEFLDVAAKMKEQGYVMCFSLLDTDMYNMTTTANVAKPAGSIDYSVKEFFDTLSSNGYFIDEAWGTSYFNETKGDKEIFGYFCNSDDKDSNPLGLNNNIKACQGPVESAGGEQYLLVNNKNIGNDVAKQFLNTLCCDTEDMKDIVDIMAYRNEFVNNKEAAQQLIAEGKGGVDILGGQNIYAIWDSVAKSIYGSNHVPDYFNITTDGGTFDGNHYYLPGGTMVKDAFFCDGTYTYYLQADGTPMKDRLTYHPDGKHVIYLDENGHEVFSDFVNVRKTISGETVDDYCFFDVNGYLYVDVVTYDKTGQYLYYANPYGVLERGKWFKFSNTVMCADGTPWNGAAGNFGYANADGTLMVNTYTYDWEGRLCYMQGNGVALY